MIWVSLLMSLGVLAGVVVGQVKYGPYKGPPVVPVILPGGFLADTQEVAALKEYHLKALAQTAKDVKDDGARDYYNTRTYQPAAPRYQPQAQKLLYKAVFQPQPQRYSQPQPQRYTQSQPQRYSHAQPQRYTQQQRYEAPSGLYRAEPAYRPAPVYEQTSAQNYDDEDYREDVQYAYTTPRPDPQVTPVILANGYLGDTPEVDAAKQEHFAAVAKAQEAVARAADRAAKQQAPVSYRAPPPAAPAHTAEAPQGYADYID